MKRAFHYLVQKREIAQRYTPLIQILKAKNTHLRTTGVVQAYHNFFIPAPSPPGYKLQHPYPKIFALYSPQFRSHQDTKMTTS